MEPLEFQTVKHACWWMEEVHNGHTFNTFEDLRQFDTEYYNFKPNYEKKRQDPSIISLRRRLQEFAAAVKRGE